jgi:hypothetical protein
MVIDANVDLKSFPVIGEAFSIEKDYSLVTIHPTLFQCHPPRRNHPPDTVPSRADRLFERRDAVARMRVRLKKQAQAVGLAIRSHTIERFEIGERIIPGAGDIVDPLAIGFELCVFVKRSRAYFRSLPGELLERLLLGLPSQKIPAVRDQALLLHKPHLMTQIHMRDFVPQNGGKFRLVLQRFIETAGDENIAARRRKGVNIVGFYDAEGPAEVGTFALKRDAASDEIDIMLE